MLFTSDNWSGVHPSILEAMVAVNAGAMAAYGNDDLTAQTQAAFEDIFEQEIAMGLVATGSAANALALACLVPPWGGVLAHKEAHVHGDECGAPEFFAGGAKLIPVQGEHGKLTPKDVDEAMGFYTPQAYHRVQPKALSITQGTEAGTVYTAAEVGALCEMAKSHGLAVHMDGARFSNACAANGEAPADISAKAGVDVLTFGGTKNGCMVAEAVIFFNHQLAEELPWRQKRAGQVFSKNRYLAAQWSAFLKDELWLNLAAEANGRAADLSKALVARPGCKVVHPTEINEVFVQMADPLAAYLRDAGAQFYDWIQPDDPFAGTLRRFVTSYETTAAEVDSFLETLSGFRG